MRPHLEINGRIEKILEHGKNTGKIWDICQLDDGGDLVVAPSRSVLRRGRMDVLHISNLVPTFCKV